MDSDTASKTVRNIEALIASPGWKDWWMPALQKMQDDYKESLTKEISETETTKLRARIALLKELARKPGEAIRVAKDALKANPADE